jgi:hypothetical protein
MRASEAYAMRNGPRIEISTSRVKNGGGQSGSKGRWMAARGLASTVALIAVVAAAVVVGIYFLGQAVAGGTTSSTLTTSSSGTETAMQGVVTGYVTVGPAQPVCSVNQNCNVNLTGYSLVFTPICSGSTSTCNSSSAPISPSGHYSVLLPAGNYTVTGLYPNCQWAGCSSAFPKGIAVQGGMQLVFDVSIDTGIR